MKWYEIFSMIAVIMSFLNMFINASIERRIDWKLHDLKSMLDEHIYESDKEKKDNLRKWIIY